MKHPILASAVVGLILIIVGCVAFNAHGGTGSPAQGAFIFIGGFFLCVVPFFYCLWSLNRGINKNLKVVQQGIPTPQVIRDQFLVSMGREPTIQEVADLQQMAKRRHDEALLNVGIGAAAVVGGLYLSKHPLGK